MIRFFDKEVACVLDTELERHAVLDYFFRNGMDEIVCVVNAEGEFEGYVTYYSLIMCDNVWDAVLRNYITLDQDIWKSGREYIRNYEPKTIGDYMIIPVVNRQKQLVSFAWDDGVANRELRQLRELTELSENLGGGGRKRKFVSVR